MIYLYSKVLCHQKYLSTFVSINRDSFLLFESSRQSRKELVKLFIKTGRIKMMDSVFFLLLGHIATFLG